MHENLNVTGGQSPGPWQPANAMLGVCIPLAFGEEKKCSRGLPGDALTDHLWPLELLQGRAEELRVCWMWPSAQGWCHPHSLLLAGMAVAPALPGVVVSGTGRL